MITTHPEIEYKCLINEYQYRQLLAFYHGKYQETEQLNLYYQDQNGMIEQYHAVLRKRIIGDSTLLTFKIPDGNDLLEIEMVSDDLLNPEFLTALSHYQIYPPFTKVAKLLTIRRKVDLPDAELCIDENHYGGIVDYEVEYELKQHQAGLPDFIAILAKAGITYQANSLSKYQRALKKKRKPL